MVNIWDLNAVRPASTTKPMCASASSVKDRGIAAAYDPSGMVISAAVASSEVQLFDVRELGRGPFKSAPIPFSSAADQSQTLVAGIRFVPPVGDYILLTMTDGTSRLIDAFSLQQHLALSSPSRGAHGHASPGDSASKTTVERMSQASLGQNMTVTPDGKTVIAGCENGGVAFWDIANRLDPHMQESDGLYTLSPDGVWSGSHDGPVSVCSFNPHMMECITGSSSLAFWTSG
ncbi:hypothetical protein GGI12_006348 [Dipsacomyces acuminosporus]|nr:hypothetical protein GGI12_006348 [Dipsacomyces acuminosporus]